MLQQLCFAENADFLPFVFVPLVFVLIITAIIVVTINKKKADKRQQEIYQQKVKESRDDIGRTAHQRDYLNAKRRELAERKVAAYGERNVTGSDGHEHLGTTEERYDPIVGSLGEVDDEGCEEMDGVRLLEHDEAYCDDPDHMVDMNYDELKRAIVMGEVINSPRFNNPFEKRK